MGGVLPSVDWLSDVKKKKKVPHDPRPLCPPAEKSQAGLKPPIVVPSHRITKAPAVREGQGVGIRMGLGWEGVSMVCVWWGGGGVSLPAQTQSCDRTWPYLIKGKRSLPNNWAIKDYF